jgi:hypothetical protein
MELMVFWVKSTALVGDWAGLDSRRFPRAEGPVDITKVKNAHPRPKRSAWLHLAGAQILLVDLRGTRRRDDFARLICIALPL